MQNSNANKQMNVLGDHAMSLAEADAVLARFGFVEDNAAVAEVALA